MTNFDYKKIAVQWREQKIPIFKPRNILLDLDNDFIWAVIGPRRAGKTYVCFQAIHSLLKAGVPNKNVLYINFEDEKLLNAQAEDIQGILDAFYELYPPDPKFKVYLFLDEIHNVLNWQKWTRRVHESQKNIKLVVTGSSAKLLSKELATELRGRVLVKEIYPLSFGEYLNWQNVAINTDTIAFSQEKNIVKNYFNDYLQNGGYPAVILNKSELKDQILQQYFDNMLFNDVIERYRIADAKKLKTLCSLLFESVAREFSFSNTAHRLVNAGFKLSKNTIINYINYFEDAYLFFQNTKYEYSLSKQVGSIKKIYCLDNGLLNAVSFKFSSDVGRLLENMVFIELKRRGQIVFYHREKKECDFLVNEKNQITAAIQVSAELTENNYEREIAGLLEAMDKHKLETGFILTLDHSEQKQAGAKKIIFVPVWQWLLT